MVGKPIRKSNLHASPQGTLVHSCRSLLSHCGLILGLEDLKWCARADLHLGGKKKEKKNEGIEWFVKSPFITIACVEKATYTAYLTLSLLRQSYECETKIHRLSGVTLSDCSWEKKHVTLCLKITGKLNDPGRQKLRRARWKILMKQFYKCTMKARVTTSMVGMEYSNCMWNKMEHQWASFCRTEDTNWQRSLLHAGDTNPSPPTFLLLFLSVERPQSSSWLFLSLYGACWVCSCCRNPPNSDMDYRIFIVRTDVNACDCTPGCTGTVRESAWKLDSRGKIPCRTRESNLGQRRAGPMF